MDSESIFKSSNFRDIMASVYDVGEPESSEDDAISLTSTVESEEQSEYEVDCILAEWEDVEDGEISYLTKWEGYPEERATWQARNTFNDINHEDGHDVLEDWQQRRELIAKGLEKAYDVVAWETTVDKIKEDKAARKSRRKRKKARLGNLVDSLSSDSDGETSSQDDDALNSVSGDSSSVVLEAPWLDTEQQYFMKGLQEANGPNWTQILAWYGHRGTINRVLREKTMRDLHRQLKRLRKEFVDAGREPPEYMNTSKVRPKFKTSRSNPQSRRHSRVKSREKNGSTESDTSTDSMMEELKKSKATKATLTSSRPDGAPKKGASPVKEYIKKLKSGTAVGSSRPSTIKKEASPPKLMSNIPEPRAQAGTSHPDVTTRDVLPSNKSSNGTRQASRPALAKDPNARMEPPKRAYSGTARLLGAAPTGPPSLPNRSRMGSSASGPARFPTSKKKTKAPQPAQKPSVSGIDVTANLSTEPKIRKMKTLPTSNAVAGTGKAPQMFKSLSLKNNVQKWRRNEPAPDPVQLIFLDRKTGKALKNVCTHSAANASVIKPLKTPFEQFQEECAAREAEERQGKESEDTMMHDDIPMITEDTALTRALELDDTLASAGSVDIPRGFSPTEQDRRPVDKGVGKRNQSLFFPQPSTTPESLPTPHLATTPIPPSNAPTGPRSSIDIPLASSVNTAAHISTRVEPSAEPISLTIMGAPTSREKYELFNRHEVNLVLGNIRVGLALEDIGKMKLAGFNRDVQGLLLRNKENGQSRYISFDFKRICTLPEYERYFHTEPINYLGSGYVVPYPDTQEKYEAMTEVLACHMSVGICFAREFTMVIWPAHTSIWRFLEQSLDAVPAGTLLRFAVREPMSREFADEVEPAMTTRLRLQNSERCEEIKTKIRDTPIQPEEKNVNVVFRDIFGLQYSRLISQNMPQKTPSVRSFFLCFIPAECENYEPDDAKRQALRRRASEEHDFFIDFLRANGVEDIYSMQDIGSCEIANNGAWDYFRHNPKYGTIIIHERCGRIDQLPHLAKVMREGTVNVWMVSLTPMSLEVENHPHLVRLFPHGGVILLTTSLMLYHPYEALRILRWFRLVHLPMKPSGTWKLATRPRIREWLLDIQDLCSEDTHECPWGFPSQIFGDIYSEIWLLLDRPYEPFGLMVEKWDIEVSNRHAPVLIPPIHPRIKNRREWRGDTFGTAELDHDAIHWIDEEMIQWFAEWAGVHLDEHRKFQVVLGYPKGDKSGDYVTKCYEKGYGYLEYGPNEPGMQERGQYKRLRDGTVVKSLWERNFLDITSYESLFNSHKVTDQAKLDGHEVRRRRKLKEDLPRVRAAAAKERKEEREAARVGLETVLQICRDRGGTEEGARAAGRRHLMWLRDEYGAASDKEVRECRVDAELRKPNMYRQMGVLMRGSEEEKAEARREQEREERRLAEKERLIGRIEERERLWEVEVERWAEMDRDRGPRGGESGGERSGSGNSEIMDIDGASEEGEVS